MAKLIFNYPYMLFGKCSCTNQIPIQAMELHNKPSETIMTYKLQCPVCGSNLNQMIKVNESNTELSNFINAFKVIPTLKDELCIVKLDTVTARLHEDELKLYGNYTYLRFWDNVVQKDKIKIDFKIED